MMRAAVLPAILSATLTILLWGVLPGFPTVSGRLAEEEEDQDSSEKDAQHHHESGANASMAPHHAHMGPHMKWTSRRPADPEDARRAGDILIRLREAVAKYRDYHAAIADGFEPFHPEIAQPHYHFTSKWRGFKAAFRFNPAEPTSLLYKKTAGGYELEGVMYTAPKRMSEEQLHERVPLSVAQWHAHINICLPPKKHAALADWTRFGFKGSIATEQECALAKG
jgi:hypothetical protein